MFRIDHKFVRMGDDPGIKEKARLEQEEEERQRQLEELRAEAQAELDVLRAQKAELELMTRELLSKAEAEAAQLLENALTEAEQIRETARLDGYNDGKAVVSAEFEVARREDETELRNVISELGKAKSQMLGSIEDDFLKLTFAVVKKIFRDSNRIDDTMFESMILTAFSQMKLEGKVVIRVSPNEYERFFASGSSSFRVNDEEINVSVIPDPNLIEGGLIIDTENETLNAGLDSQLKYIEIAFRSAVSNN